MMTGQSEQVGEGKKSWTTERLEMKMCKSRHGAKELQRNFALPVTAMRSWTSAQIDMKMLIESRTPEEGAARHLMNIPGAH